MKFYDNPSLSKDVTASFITFVPKIRNLQLLSNYKPICLVSCFQKLLSKIMVVCFKKVVGSIVSVEQFAFIFGRSIFDGGVMVN